jgi:hypothetical protein
VLLIDALRFVVDFERYLLELVGMLLAVVGAEEKVEPAGHGDPDISLRAAPIATIRGVQCGTFDDGSIHAGPRFLTIRCLSDDLVCAGERIVLLTHILAYPQHLACV